MSDQSVGQTSNFDYKYQNSLTDAQTALQRAQYFYTSGFCETDLATLQTWFSVSGGFGPGNRITAVIDRSGALGTNGGYQTGGKTTIQVAPFDGQPAGEPVAQSEAQCRAVLVAELSEVLMGYRNQQTGVSTWLAGNSMGEALSTVCEALLHPEGYYAPASLGPRIGQWLNASPRPNWIDQVENTDKHFPSIGCGIMFIYYLMHEFDFSINQIITQAGSTFELTFQKLTGTSGSWGIFSSLVQSYFPSGIQYNPTSDDILPHPGKGPALAVFEGKLVSAWKGESGDDRLFFSLFSGTTWATQKTIPGNSNIGTSLAVYNSKLYAAYKGEPGDQRVFYISFDGANWAPQAQIPNVASSIGPSLAVFNSKLYAAWKGQHADQGLYFSSFDGTNWAPQTQIPNVASSIGPSLAVFNGRLYAAWKGELFDQKIYFASFDGSHWSPQAIIPVVASSIGPSLAVFNGKLYATYKGALTDPTIFYTSFDGTQWIPQATVPGNTSPDL